MNAAAQKPAQSQAVCLRLIQRKPLSYEALSCAGWVVEWFMTAVLKATIPTAARAHLPQQRQQRQRLLPSAPRELRELAARRDVRESAQPATNRKSSATAARSGMFQTGE